MDHKIPLLLFFTVFSVGRSQFVIKYPRSEFENIQLGQPPNGIYIPPDSFLNALRDRSYRGSFTAAPQTNPNPVNYNLPAPQSTFYVQPPPAPQQNSMPPSDMADKNQVEEPRPRRRTIRKRQKISREQNGTPITFSPSSFENIGYGEVPDGVYVPPDSLLNVLRNPSTGRRNAQRTSQIEPSNSFGLTGSYGNTNPQYLDQPSVMGEEQTYRYPVMEDITPEADDKAFSTSNTEPEAYGRKLNPRTRATQTTQGRQMPRNRPPSVALDPSMEYPADVPREQMQWVPRSVVQYADFGENTQQGSGRQRTPKRRQSQRKRKQTGVKPDYVEPEYPPRTYSPSVFETISLGEPPSGVRIPSDSMLNLLKDDDQQVRSPKPQRTLAMSQQPRVSMSLASNEDEMQTAENPSQYSRMTVTRKRTRQESGQAISSDLETDGDFGTRRRQNNPVQTFPESSQPRQRPQRRNSGVSRRSRNEE